MLEKYQCWFCGREFPICVGLIFVKNDGSIYHFCSSKCRRSFQLGRNPRKLRWARAE